MKRSILLVCLLLSFVLGGIFLTLPRTEAQSSVPAGWTGIYDRDGLAAVSANPGGKYILMNDIDLSASPWTALCSEDEPFTGTFDGNGHTVYGMTVSHSVKACGLFSYLFGGTVKNLTVSGSASGPIAGLLAGKIGKGTVTGCTVSGTVSSQYFAGGLTGQISGQAVTLSDCRSSVTVTGAGASGSELFSGGLVGAVYGSGHVISGCLFSGTLSPSGSALSVGGIAGAADGGVSFADCSTEGSLSLTYTDSVSAGGIAGRAGASGAAAFLRCTYKSDWTVSGCSGPQYLGGIVGQIGAYGSVSLSACRTYGSITGRGHDNFLKISDSYKCINCSVLLEDAGPVSHLGGIAGGVFAAESWVSVSQCASYTSLSAKGGPVVMGGIVGSNRAEGGSAVVHDCLSAGKITYNTSVWGDLFSPIGGVCGSLGGAGDARIRQCVSLCEMNVAYPLIDGAVIGYYDASGGATVTQCYYRAGEREFFATPLSGAGLSDPSAYAGLDFTSVWKTDPTSGLPRLRIEDGVSACPKGDVDGDGRVTRYDGVMLSQYLTGAAALSDAQRSRADVNGDGTADSRDLMQILRSIS